MYGHPLAFGTAVVSFHQPFGLSHIDCVNGIALNNGPISQQMIPVILNATTVGLATKEHSVGEQWQCNTMCHSRHESLHTMQNRINTCGGIWDSNIAIVSCNFK